MGVRRRTLVLGNSHTDAIREVARNSDTVSVHWLINKKSTHGAISIEEARRKVSTLSPEDRLVILHFGTLHNIYGLLNHEQPFAMVGTVPQDTQTTIIPRGTMKAMMTARIPRENVVVDLTRNAICPAYHIMSPPPKEVLEMPKSTEKAYRGYSIQKMGFSPAPQRLAMWELECEVIGEYLDTIGVVHIGIIPGTQTDEGYLNPDYCARDNTHANSIYGAKLVEYLSSLPA